MKFSFIYGEFRERMLIVSFYFAYLRLCYNFALDLILNSMAKYPKKISHRGYNVIKHGIGKYSYKGYTIVKEGPFDLFHIHPELPVHIAMDFGSLVWCCECIDFSLKAPGICNLPIEIVEINGKPV